MKIKKITNSAPLKYVRDDFSMEVPMNIKLKYTLSDDLTEAYDVEVMSVSLAVKGLFTNKAMAEIKSVAKQQAVKYIEENKEKELGNYNTTMKQIDEVNKQKKAEIEASKKTEAIDEKEE